MRHLSHDIFTKLSTSSALLEWYGTADKCKMLMRQLRSGSRKLWDENLKEWSHKLIPVKENAEISWGDFGKLYRFFKNQRYATYRVVLKVSNESHLKVLFNYLNEIPDPSIITIDKVRYY